MHIFVHIHYQRGHGCISVILWLQLFQPGKTHCINHCWLYDGMGSCLFMSRTHLFITIIAYLWYRRKQVVRTNASELNQSEGDRWFNWSLDQMPSWNAFTLLLAAGKNCDQQGAADQVIDLAKHWTMTLTRSVFSQISVQQPRNVVSHATLVRLCPANDFMQSDSLRVPYYLTAPKNQEPNGLFHYQFSSSDFIKFSGDQTGNPPRLKSGESFRCLPSQVRWTCSWLHLTQHPCGFAWCCCMSSSVASSSTSADSSSTSSASNIGH